MPSPAFPVECTYTWGLTASCYKKWFIRVVYLNVLQKRRAFSPPLVKYLVFLFALGSDDISSCFHQRQRQRGDVSVPSRGRHSMTAKGAFERVKAKRGTWHPLFSRQLLALFGITLLKFIWVLWGWIYGKSPDWSFSKALSKTGKGLHVRYSLFLHSRGFLCRSSPTRWPALCLDSHGAAQLPTSSSTCSTFPACGQRASGRGETRNQLQARYRGVVTTGSYWKAPTVPERSWFCSIFVYQVFHDALHAIASCLIAEDTNQTEADKRSRCVFPPSPAPCLQRHESQCTSHFHFCF